MKKLNCLLLVLFVTVWTSCKKNPVDITGDEVTGRYSGTYADPLSPPAAVQFEIYKTAARQYGVRKLSSAPFPDHTAHLDETMYLVGDILGIRYYNIPAQTVGAQVLGNSSSVAYTMSSRYVSIELKDMSATLLWRISGTKQ